jgi:hypothetical protein
MVCKAKWGKGFVVIQLIHDLRQRVIVCCVPFGAEQHNDICNMHKGESTTDEEKSH